jgi:hypothetical protein
MTRSDIFLILIGSKVNQKESVGLIIFKWALTPERQLKILRSVLACENDSYDKLSQQWEFSYTKLIILYHK